MIQKLFSGGGGAKNVVCAHKEKKIENFTSCLKSFPFVETNCGLPDFYYFFICSIPKCIYPNINQQSIDKIHRKTLNGRN